MMNRTEIELPSPGKRGPAAHRTRTQLLEAADEHFRHYGYGKTTVADLAKAIQVSPAYVYRFFKSKQAIGEAVCAMTLGRMTASLLAVENESRPAAERLRKIYRTAVTQGFELYFGERKLHDIVTAAVEGQWCSVAAYRDELGSLVERVVTEGRQAGEFERLTPLVDVCRAIICTLTPFVHPSLLAQSDPAELESSAEQVANLVLRSLHPL